METGSAVVGVEESAVITIARGGMSPFRQGYMVGGGVDGDDAEG